jgi:lipopolysaccharide transport system permease protein
MDRNTIIARAESLPGPLGARSWTRRLLGEQAAKRVGVLVSLTLSDLRARYGRGPWQLLKWLSDPFAVVGIYLLLVTFLLDRGGIAPGLSLACAVVPFQLVTMAIINAMSAIDLRQSIILNMRFDRTLIPISSAMTETVAFAASFLLIGLMMASYQVAPTVAALWLPVVIGVNFFFAVACAYLASLVGLWFRDLRAFILSFVRAMFFLAPGLVPLALIGGRANELVKINPLTGLFEAYRSTLLYGHRPAAWQLLYPAFVAAALLVALVPVYRREQRQFAKVIG